MPLPIETDRVFSTGYEDFYQDTNPNMEQAIPDESALGDQSVDGENPVLRFRQPVYNFALLDYSLRRTTVQLNCRLHGMFFIAAPPPTDASPTQGTSFPELTCYRRNLYSISGSIAVPRSLRYILTDHGDRVPIIAQELQVSATESNEGGPVKLIVIPWKTSLANNVPVSEPKGDYPEPATLPLDIMSNQDLDAEFATFPISWKRMQFRVATANNGRRRELQQHFTLHIKLMATLATGAKVAVAEAKSNSIIVRGRSPRNFATRKEQPVGGEKGAARKQSPQNRSPTNPSPSKSPMQPPPGLTRRPTGDLKNPLKRERSGEETAPFSPFEFNFRDPRQSPTSAATSASPTTAGSARIPTMSTPTLPSSKSTSVSLSPPPLAPGTTAASSFPLTKTVAINNTCTPNALSQRPNKRARTASESPPQPHKRPTLPGGMSNNAKQVPNSNASASFDSADLLYDYFPLGMNQWMPPVDAHMGTHHSAPMVTGPPTPGGIADARQKTSGANNQRYSSCDVMTTVGLGLAGVATSGAS